jgi:predicted dehydrogenase
MGDKALNDSVAPLGVAVVGCGSVSRHYLRTLRLFGILDVRYCCDLIPERAAERVRQFGLGVPSALDQALADPAVEIIVNLTPPAEHATVTRQGLAAGKSVYVEKPFTTTAAETRELLTLASRNGALIACAPDTMLGRGVQTARKIVADGGIGQPTAALATMANAGHELWHPDPQYYYLPGAGPLWDMGPYYLSLLVTLLGPVRSVSADQMISPRERRVATGPREGSRVRVETPTTVMAVLDFASTALATLTCTFDAWATMVPCVEVYGTSGALQAADPNIFGGPVLVSAGGAGWHEVELVPGYAVERGIGVADLALAVRTGAAPRASAELAVHVTDIMAAIGESATTRRNVLVPSSVWVPRPMPAELADYGWRGLGDGADDARLAALS